MLTSLSLNNFKSWKEIGGMRLAPITGLFGPNSSGKTSILQLLLMLKQTVNSPDRAQVLNLGDDRGFTALGTLEDVVHKGVQPRELGWKLVWEPRRAWLVPDWMEGDPLLQSDEVSFEARVRRSVNRSMVVQRFAYSFHGRVFGMERRDGSLSEYQFFTAPDPSLFKRLSDRPDVFPPPIKCYGFPHHVNASYQNTGVLADLELFFEELFERVYYLGPLREYPERAYTWAGGQPADVGKRGENAVAALLAARESGVKISRGKGRPRWSLEEYVARWLRELRLVHSFSVEAITEGSNLYRVWVQQAPDGPKVLLTDIGFGISQILPVLVLCYYVPEGSILLLEQPEIHLHPRVQAELADVLIDAVKVRKIQILVESHSEHLLLRLQRRMAEQKRGFTSEDAALYFCELREGTSHLVPLDLDEYGNIRNWPEGFFGDAFEETAARMEEEMKRKKREAA